MLDHLGAIHEAWGHWAMGGYHMFCGQHDRAIAAYEKALELNPNDADVLNDFGQCLSYAPIVRHSALTQQSMGGKIP